jgi:hypothetical protein
MVAASLAGCIPVVAGERKRSLSQYIELALEAHIEAVRGKKPKTKS